MNKTVSLLFIFAFLIPFIASQPKVERNLHLAFTTNKTSLYAKPCTTSAKISVAKGTILRAKSPFMQKGFIRVTPPLGIGLKHGKYYILRINVSYFSRVIALDKRTPVYASFGDARSENDRTSFNDRARYLSNVIAKLVYPCIVGNKSILKVQFIPKKYSSSALKLKSFWVLIRLKKNQKQEINLRQIKQITNYLSKAKTSKNTLCKLKETAYYKKWAERLIGDNRTISIGKEFPTEKEVQSYYRNK